MKVSKLKNRFALFGLLYTLATMLAVIIIVNWGEKVSVARLTRNQVDATIKSLDSPIFAFLYELQDWVHLLESLDVLKKNDSVVYAYLVKDSTNEIEVGIQGYEDQFINKQFYPWEASIKFNNFDKTQPQWHPLILHKDVKVNNETILKKEMPLFLVTIPLNSHITKTHLGELRLMISGEATQQILSQTKYAVLLISALFVGLSAFIFYVFARRITAPIEEISEQISSIQPETIQQLGDKHFKLSRVSKIEEIVSLRSSIETMIVELVGAHQREQQFLAEREVTKVATQVAHDIRSPLSSMQAALGYFNKMKITDPKAPGALNLLELSANRLTSIADNLLKKHKGQKDDKILFNLHKVLDELIGEYQAREEFKEMKFVKHYVSQAVQLVGDRSKLQRAFGNIIKNAVEAMQSIGTMTITTQLGEEGVLVSLADTGPGIAKDKLDKILQGGFTEGKQDGHGIGMKVVSETVKELRGNLTAESKIGKGTTFIIHLPTPSEETRTNVEKEKELIEQMTLNVPVKKPVLVVDDDPSLREQWRMVLNDHGVETILCESHEDLLQNIAVMTKTKTAIVDYTFHNSKMTGEDVIRYLQSNGFNNLTLCTAEYWRPDMHRLAKELGVQLCPKPLPRILVTTGNGYTVLVIDDDKGIRLTWEFQQEKLGIKVLHSYANLEALQSNGIELATIDIAFVDKNIEGSQFSGAQVVEFLKAKGIAKIVLASGEDAATLKADPQFAKADYILNEKIPQDMKQFFL